MFGLQVEECFIMKFLSFNNKALTLFAAVVVFGMAAVLLGSESKDNKKAAGRPSTVHAASQCFVRARRVRFEPAHHRGAGSTGTTGEIRPRSYEHHLEQ